MNYLVVVDFGEYIENYYFDTFSDLINFFNAGFFSQEFEAYSVYKLESLLLNG